MKQEEEQSVELWLLKQYVAGARYGWYKVWP